MSQNNKILKQNNTAKGSDYSDVPSKLYEPTAAFNAQSIKYVDKENLSMKPTKPIDDNHQLLRPTRAVVNGIYKREAIEREAEQRAALDRAMIPVTIPERLLAPTAANFYSSLHVQNGNPTADEDDIWWEKRKTSKGEAVENSPNLYDHVNSRLYDSTLSYDSQVYSRIDKPIDASISMPMPIDDDSPVLRPTYSVIYGSYYKAEEPIPAPKPSVFRLLSQQSGPKNIESKLYHPTESYKSAVYKSKEDRELEEEIRREEDINARKKDDDKKVSRPSDHVMMPTQARLHAIHQRKDHDMNTLGWKHPSRRVNFTNDESTSISSSTKIVEPSARLLQPTAGLQHAKWKGSSSGLSYEPWYDKEKDVEIQLSDRLLEYTKSMRNGFYQKPESDADPRELTWQSHTVKPPKDIFTMKDEPESSILQPQYKVVEPSSHLLTPTANLVSSAWRGPSDPDASTYDQQHHHMMKKQVSIKPVSSNEHFLSATASTHFGAYRKPPSPTRVSLRSLVSVKNLAKMFSGSSSSQHDDDVDDKKKMTASYRCQICQLYRGDCPHIIIPSSNNISELVLHSKDRSKGTPLSKPKPSSLMMSSEERQKRRVHIQAPSSPPSSSSSSSSKNLTLATRNPTPFQRPRKAFNHPIDDDYKPATSSSTSSSSAKRQATPYRAKPKLSVIIPSPSSASSSSPSASNRKRQATPYRAKVSVIIPSSSASSPSSSSPKPTVIIPSSSSSSAPSSSSKPKLTVTISSPPPSSSSSSSSKIQRRQQTPMISKKKMINDKDVHHHNEPAIIMRRHVKMEDDMILVSSSSSSSHDISIDKDDDSNNIINTDHDMMISTSTDDHVDDHQHDYVDDHDDDHVDDHDHDVEDDIISSSAAIIDDVDDDEPAASSSHVDDDIIIETNDADDVEIQPSSSSSSSSAVVIQDDAMIPDDDVIIHDDHIPSDDVIIQDDVMIHDDAMIHDDVIIHDAVMIQDEAMMIHDDETSVTIEASDALIIDDDVMMVPALTPDDPIVASIIDAALTSHITSSSTTTTSSSSEMMISDEEIIIHDRHDIIDDHLISSATSHDDNTTIRASSYQLHHQDSKSQIIIVDTITDDATTIILDPVILDDDHHMNIHDHTSSSSAIVYHDDSINIAHELIIEDAVHVYEAQEEMIDTDELPYRSITPSFDIISSASSDDDMIIAATSSSDNHHSIGMAMLEDDPDVPIPPAILDSPQYSPSPRSSLMQPRLSSVGRRESMNFGVGQVIIDDDDEEEEDRRRLSQADTKEFISVHSAEESGYVDDRKEGDDINV